MTVQEMIDHLTELKNEGFGNTEMILSITDHTDWTYNFELPEFEVDNVYDDDFDDETDYVVCKVSI